MQKLAIGVVALVLILGGAYYFKSAGSLSDTAGVPQAQNITPPSGAPIVAPTPATAPVTAPTPAPSATTIIRFTDLGYTPSSITVNKGETVTFKNESSSPTWPASAMHPTHTAYPTTGGCIGSTFDACRGLKTGEEWSFVFDAVGTWKYHDHINMGNYGTVVVE